MIYNDKSHINLLSFSYYFIVNLFFLFLYFSTIISIGEKDRTIGIWRVHQYFKQTA